MSKIETVVNSLEVGVESLLQKVMSLEQENERLNKELLQTQKKNTLLNEQLVSWQKKHETLKVVNAILGSNENKQETKLKINALIRDIDYCIAQLSI